MPLFHGGSSVTPGLVDTADIVNRKRERAVDTGEVQAEGVKHETATETKEAVDTGIERATSLTRRAFLQ